MSFSGWGVPSIWRREGIREVSQRLIRPLVARSVRVQADADARLTPPPRTVRRGDRRVQVVEVRAAGCAGRGLVVRYHRPKLAGRRGGLDGRAPGASHRSPHRRAAGVAERPGAARAGDGDVRLRGAVRGRGRRPAPAEALGRMDDGDRDRIVHPLRAARSGQAARAGQGRGAGAECRDRRLPRPWYCPGMGREPPKTPLATVDVIIETDGGIVLIRRRNPPPGWALPGGFVDPGESAANAARREAKEETGLDVELTELLGVYSDPKRDPRGLYTLSTVFIGRASGRPVGADDAAEARVFPADAVPGDVAFDHPTIIADYRRLRAGLGRPPVDR